MSRWTVGSGRFRIAPASASCWRRPEGFNPGGDMYRFVALIFITAGCCIAQEGTRVYIAHCQQCHDQNSDAHAPLPEALATRPWEAILTSLENGAMRVQGAQLTPEERRAVARYLGKAGPVTPPVMTGRCPAGAKPQSGNSSWNKSSWNGWS